MGERNLDQELVERVQNGEKAAFDILVRKYAREALKQLDADPTEPT